MWERAMHVPSVCAAMKARQLGTQLRQVQVNLVLRSAHRLTSVKNFSVRLV
jgi:hypothetical protein